METETLEHYETILEHIHDGVYTLDAAGRITWVNETVIDEFDIGYTRDELIGSFVSKVLSEEDIEKCLEIIQNCITNEDQESGRCEITIHTADGQEIPCDLHLALLPFQDGEFQGTVGVVRDITERKRRDQRLTVLHRVLRHNLRNDMTTILGRADNLESVVDEPNEKDVHVIQEVGDDLLALSDKVRWLSELREQAGDQPVSIDIHEEIEQIIDEFRADFPTVEFSLSMNPSTPITAKVGSEDLFTVAIRNIIDNAIEHNDASTPRISVSVTQDGGRSQIRVEDNGPGLPEMEQTVFESESESPLEHSSGFGLWLGYWCVTASGGDIRFNQSDGSGTTVSLDFPSGEHSPEIEAK